MPWAPFSLGSSRRFKLNLCYFPLSKFGVAPAINIFFLFFFFKRRAHQKNRIYGHFYRSWANTLANVKQIHFLSTLSSGRSLRL